MKFMEINNLGLCLLAVLLLFHLHLESTVSSPSPLFPTAVNQVQDVKDKPLMEKLSSRVGIGKMKTVSRRGGHGGGHGGRGSRGGHRGQGDGSSKSPNTKGGGGAAAGIRPINVGGNHHHNNCSHNTGSPTALVIYTWSLLFLLYFFSYI